METFPKLSLNPLRSRKEARAWLEANRPQVYISEDTTPPATPATPAAPATKPENAAAKSSKPNDEADTQPQQRSEWTEEQDAQLKKLKAEGTIWREIGQALGKSQDSCKRRFKELNAGGEGAEASGNGGKDKDDVKKNDSHKDGEKKNDSNKDDEKKNNQNEDKKGKKNGDGNKANGTANVEKASDGKPVRVIIELEDGSFDYVDPDDVFSAKDLQLLVRLSAEDNDAVFERIASRFYDHEGRRIDPEEIRKRFGKQKSNKGK